MTDETYPPAVRQFIDDTMKLLASLPRTGPLPREVVEAARSLQPYTANVAATMEQLAAFNRMSAIENRRLAAYREMAETLTAHRIPVPTPEDMLEAEAELRARVLPGTSEQELAEAVSAIPADPEKVKLAAFLAGLIDQATGVPGSSPWVVFLVVFCIAVKADPDVVGALGLAFAVLAVVKGD